MIWDPYTQLSACEGQEEQGPTGSTTSKGQRGDICSPLPDHPNTVIPSVTSAHSPLSNLFTSPSFPIPAFLGIPHLLTLFIRHHTHISRTLLPESSCTSFIHLMFAPSYKNKPGFFGGQVTGTHLTPFDFCHCYSTKPHVLL